MIALGDDMHTTQPKGRQQHPVVVAHRAHRAADLQLRVADGITAFVGSMPFVYIHAALFSIWRFLAVSSGFGDQVSVVPAWRVDEGGDVSLAA
jgi:uncharacterized membrane protein